jgi:hypothetical protein
MSKGQKEIEEQNLHIRRKNIPERGISGIKVLR